MQYVTTCKHEILLVIYMYFIKNFFFIFRVFFLNFRLWKTCLIFVIVIIYRVDSRMTTLMSISDGLDPYFFRRKVEKTWSMKDQIDGEVFNSPCSW